MCNPTNVSHGEILASGTVKIVSNVYTGEAHLTYEKALLYISEQMGGEVTREKRKDVSEHEHNHEHSHVHA